MILFDDRVDAGRQLAAQLDHLKGQDVVVLGLPRGGVPVAFEVAKALDAPLDVIVVRKLGLPSQPELAMGAIGEGGVRVLNDEVLLGLEVRDEDLAAVERRAHDQLTARVDRLRGGRGSVDLTGRVAIVVDDGVATGSTARVACKVARRLGAATVVLAVPVAPADRVDAFPEADQVVCVFAPQDFRAVGNHYRNFAPTSDEEVAYLLDAASRRKSGGRLLQGEPGCDVDVEIPVAEVSLQGHLHLPESATAVVVFAHGSGSSRHSPRNRFVADVLQRAGLGTLLLDLLSPGEERNRANVFDIRLLASRLTAATRWLRARPDTASCRIGYFGASTGAGAALWAAAEPDPPIAAVVSRGGRPDMAAAHLPKVEAPTLLIVGSADALVLDLNRQALAQLQCRSTLAVVDRATHLFEEPGTLAEVASLARDWFTHYLLTGPGPASAPVR